MAKKHVEELNTLKVQIIEQHFQKCKQCPRMFSADEFLEESLMVLEGKDEAYIRNTHWWVNDVANGSVIKGKRA